MDEKTKELVRICTLFIYYVPQLTKKGRRIFCPVRSLFCERSIVDIFVFDKITCLLRQNTHNAYWNQLVKKLVHNKQ